MSGATGPRGRDGAAKSLAQGFSCIPDDGDAIIVDIGHLHTRVGLEGLDGAATSGGLPVDTPTDCMILTDPDRRSTEGPMRSWDGFEAHLAENILGPLLQRDGAGRDNLLSQCAVKPGEELDSDLYHPLMLVEQVLTKDEVRTKSAEIVFETFAAPKFYLALGSTLGLYTAGATTGLVVDLGYAGASVCPIYEGYALPHGANHNTEFGGEMMDDKLVAALPEESSGKCNPTREDLRRAREGNVEGNEDSYKLPDGTLIPAERLADEYFKSRKYGYSLPEEARESIAKSDINICSDLYSHTVLIGGGSALFGLEERFEESLRGMAHHSLREKVKTIVPSPHGDCSVIGGAILTSLSTFSNMWVSAREYDEQGPRVTLLKCLS